MQAQEGLPSGTALLLAFLLPLVIYAWNGQAGDVGKSFCFLIAEAENLSITEW